MPTPDYYRRNRLPWPGTPVIPGVDTDHWGTGAVEERGRPKVLLTPALYTRPRRTMEVRTGEGDPLLDPTYSRPRMAGEPADPLTRIAETRDYHANQTITNDDPWWKNMLKGLGRGALSGMASGQGLGGALGGALTGGVMGLAMPAMDDRLENQAEVATLDKRYAREYERQKGQLGLEALSADVEYQRRRPDLEAEKIAARGRDTAKRNLVALYNRLPEFDPDAPENADLADQMRAAGLPVVRKQASQQLRFVQDAATGAWSVIAAPKTGGQASAAAVTTAEGKPLATTSAAQMASRTAEKNLKYRQDKDLADRALRKSQHDDRMRRADAALAERVKARVSQEAARSLTAGQRAKAIKITEAKARIWAKNEGANWDDFLDALDAAEVEVTDK